MKLLAATILIFLGIALPFGPGSVRDPMPTADDMALVAAVQAVSVPLARELFPAASRCNPPRCEGDKVTCDLRIGPDGCVQWRCCARR